ncbi:MAG: hypothetical protein ABWY06_14910 [Pseudomonas sp.]|uniref:hypothetical protein n=1 Tax=Pseudomonas sp. TaxID=306 RepID=UPI003392FF08
MPQYELDVANPLTPSCDWNRLALGEHFAGIVAHGFEALLHSCSSPEEISQGLGEMVLSQVTDLLLPLEPLTMTRDIVELLRRQQTPLRVWLSPPPGEAPSETTLRQLANDLPRCGLNLRLDLAGGRVPLEDALHQLGPACRLAQALGWPLRLMLSRIGAASALQLQRCQAFALEQGFDRLTLSDEASQLTARGVSNLFRVLQPRAADMAAGGLSLEFLAGNAQRQGLGNAVAAMAAGARYIHCSLVGCVEQDQPPPLVALLEHFALPTPQQVGLDRYRDFLSQRNGLAYRSLDSRRHARPSSWPTGLQAAATTLALPPTVEELCFVFRVSSDDWHVRLCIEAGDTELDLGERVHHYLLLLLAREYCHQQTQQRLRAATSSPPDPLSLGWLERETLHRMIGDNEAQFNVKLCRALKQIGHALQSIGLDQCKPVSTRVGSLRLDVAHFRIFKDSQLQQEVRDWILLAPPDTPVGTPLQPPESP